MSISKFKKMGVVLLTLVVIPFSSVGCTSNNTTETNNAVSSDDKKINNATKEIVLKVFDAHAYGLDEYAEMVTKFEEEHPGVKVEVQHAANDSGSILQSRINANDIPDVFDVESGTVARMYYEYAYNWSNDIEVLEKFHPDAIDTGRDENGNVMSLPWTYENMGIIYNKDLFEQAGITTLPKTMDELDEACKKLDAAGITAFALSAKEPWVLGQLATHFMMDKSLNAEGVVEGLESGQLKFADMKNFNNLFRFLDLAVQYGTKKPLEIDWETAENMLANNQAAMIHMGDWCQATLDSFNADANLGFLPCPVSDNPEDVTLLSSCNWTYIVNKDSDNLELAKEYCEYILSSDMGQYWMTEGVGIVPAVKTERGIRGQLANDAKVYITKGETNSWIHTIAPVGYMDNLGPMLQSYMTGSMSSEEVTKAFQSFWDAN